MKSWAKCLLPMVYLVLLCCFRALSSKAFADESNPDSNIVCQKLRTLQTTSVPYPSVGKCELIKQVFKELRDQTGTLQPSHWKPSNYQAKMILEQIFCGEPVERCNDIRYEWWPIETPFDPMKIAVEISGKTKISKELSGVCKQFALDVNNDPELRTYCLKLALAANPSDSEWILKLLTPFPRPSQKDLSGEVIAAIDGTSVARKALPAVILIASTTNNANMRSRAGRFYLDHRNVLDQKTRNALLFAATQRCASWAKDFVAPEVPSSRKTGNVLDLMCTGVDNLCDGSSWPCPNPFRQPLTKDDLDSIINMQGTRLFPDGAPTENQEERNQVLDKLQALLPQMSEHTSGSHDDYIIGTLRRLTEHTQAIAIDKNAIAFELLYEIFSHCHYQSCSASIVELAMLFIVATSAPAKIADACRSFALDDTKGREHRALCVRIATAANSSERDWLLQLLTFEQDSLVMQAAFKGIEELSFVRSALPRTLLLSCGSYDVNAQREAATFFWLHQNLLSDQVKEAVLFAAAQSCNKEAIYMFMQTTKASQETNDVIRDMCAIR